MVAFLYAKRRDRIKFGFAGQSQESAFSRAIADGIEAAAAGANISLLIADNHDSAKTAVRNAERFVRERVDLVIEFQTDEHVAPVVSAKLLEANIPIVAVEIPHPGATYYGANNYSAGEMGGKFLGRWAREHWRAAVDEVLLLELSMAGPLPRSRLVGIVDGLRRACLRFPRRRSSGLTAEAVRSEPRGCPQTSTLSERRVDWCRRLGDPAVAVTMWGRVVRGRPGRWTHATHPTCRLLDLQSPYFNDR